MMSRAKLAGTIGVLFNLFLVAQRAQAQSTECLAKTCEEFNALLNSPSSFETYEQCIAVTTAQCSIKFTDYPIRRVRNFAELRFDTLKFDRGSAEYYGELKFNKLNGKELVLSFAKFRPFSSATSLSDRSFMTISSGKIDKINSERSFMDSFKISDAVVTALADRDLFTTRSTLGTRSISQKALIRTHTRSKSFGRVYFEDVNLAESQFESDINLENLTFKRINFNLLTVPGNNFTQVKTPSVLSSSQELKKLTTEQFVALTKDSWTQTQLTSFGEDMSALSFKGKKLRNLDFKGKNLSESDFSDADVSGSDFRGTKGLQAVNFTNTNLRGTKFCASELNILARDKAISLVSLIDLLAADAVSTRCASDAPTVRNNVFKDIRSQILSLSVDAQRQAIARLWTVGMAHRILYGDPSYAALSASELAQNNQIQKLLFDNFTPAPAAERKALWTQLCQLYELLPTDAATASNRLARQGYFAFLPFYGLARQAEDDLKEYMVRLDQAKLDTFQQEIAAQSRCVTPSTTVSEAIFLRKKLVDNFSSLNAENGFVPALLSFDRSDRSALFVADIVRDPYLALALLQAIQDQLVQGMSDPTWDSAAFASKQEEARLLYTALSSQVYGKEDQAKLDILLKNLSSLDEQAQLNTGTFLQARNYFAARNLAKSSDFRLKTLQWQAAMASANIGTQRFLEKLSDLYSWNIGFYAGKIVQGIGFNNGLTFPPILTQALYLYEEQKVQSVFAGSMFDQSGLLTFQSEFANLLADYPDLQNLADPDSGIMESNPVAYWLKDIQDASATFQNLFFDMRYLKLDVEEQTNMREFAEIKARPDNTSDTRRYGYIAKIADLTLDLSANDFALDIYFFDTSRSDYMKLASRTLLRFQTALAHSRIQKDPELAKLSSLDLGFVIHPSASLKVGIVAISDIPFESLISGNFANAQNFLSQNISSWVYASAEGIPDESIQNAQAQFLRAPGSVNPGDALRLLEIKNTYSQQ